MCFVFCTVSPAGAVAGVTTAPAPVGNSRPTALARSRDSRNCFSPTHPFTPQRPSTVLVVASSGQILHFTFKPLTFLRQNRRNFRVTFHSPICFVIVCVCVFPMDFLAVSFFRWAGGWPAASTPNLDDQVIFDQGFLLALDTLVSNYKAATFGSNLQEGQN